MLLAEYNSWDNITQYELQTIIPNMKICDPRFTNVYSKSLQYENNKLFANLKALKERRKNGHKIGRLRYKGKNWFKTIHYNQSGFRFINTGKRCDKLKLSKIGIIKIRAHNKFKGSIKQIIIKKEASGKWYASIIEERNDKKEQMKYIDIKKHVGIDLGIKDVIYDSDNKKIINPKHLKHHEQKLKKIQKIFSRKKKGSNNRNKYRIKLTIQHEKIANTRKDFIHKLSHYYVKNYDLIGLEDMDISQLVKENKYAKYILDAGWGLFRHQISYKAERAGKICVLVETKGTTYRCHKCGNYVFKELKDRIHNCSNCGIKIPRDYNSAIEIDLRALLEIGKGLAESTLVEKEAILHLKQLHSMKQEATSLTSAGC